MDKNKNMKIELESIGTIHTEFTEIEGMPIQPTGAKGIKGKLIIKDKYADGLKDLEDFSHINILYLLHKVNGYSLEVKPFMDNNTHGVFATRSPKRPNRIGSSVVKIETLWNFALSIIAFDGSISRQTITAGGQKLNIESITIRCASAPNLPRYENSVLPST